MIALKAPNRATSRETAARVGPRSLPRLGLAVAAALLAAAGGVAQTLDPDTEGYDPMRQISTQFVRPNILLVFDVSGSMAWDEINGHSVGVDETGTWLTASWSITGSGDCSGSGNGRQCLTWTAVLTVQQTHPSRMANVKNALGDSMDIITPWTPPGGTCDDPARQWPTLSWSGGTITGPTQTLDNTTNDYWDYRFTWVRTTGSTGRSPGEPFSTAGLTAQPPTIGCNCELREATDLIGKTANTVNWGLEIFSGAAADCSSATLVIPPDSRDRGDVRGLEICMRPNGDGATTIDGQAYQGLFASSSTPSKTALAFAQNVMSAVAGGGTVQNYNNRLGSSTFPGFYDNRSWSLTADAKLMCGRMYGVILVTDGLSNNCNPNDGGNWAEPCLTCNQDDDPGCPDGGPSGYTCPNPYPITKQLQLAQVDGFLAEKADALWWMTVGGRRVATRTWVIGVSDAVGPCELNYTAYRGRTDAEAAEGDTGFDTAADPYLPEGTPGNYNAPSCPSHRPPHGNYAFFPKSADQLEAAFAAILTAVGAGDYTTSAPSVTQSLVAFEGMVGFVASASYPKWLGHVYAYNLAANCADTARWDCTQPCGWEDPDTGRKSNCLWDAGEVLSIGGLNPDGSRKSANNGLARKLYTWDPTTPTTLIPIASSAVATLNTLCGDCGITAEVADFMAGNNGTGSPRDWKLGAIINSTQAVVGPAQVWKQSKLESHTQFEANYENRHPLVWVGSSDGFVHAFDVIDGAEIVALIPPEQLAKQPTLYSNYRSGPTKFPTGQLRSPTQHDYGVANSPRFGDVWFPGVNQYKTVLFVTQGPGGTGVAAIDVTHPYPGGRDLDGDGTTIDDIERADVNYDASAPVTPLWSKNRGNYTALGETWSVPALGASARDTWQLILGAGFDDALPSDGTGRPTVYRLDPVNGSIRSTETLTNQTVGDMVRNQSFADAVIWETTAPYFQQDNRVNEGIQVDLNGQLWTFAPSNWNKSSLVNAGAGQPFYYPPAVAAWPAGTSTTHRLYAFGSGTFYEKSPNVTGLSSTFVPRLYVASRAGTATPVVQNIAISSIPKPVGQTGNLGPRTQLTAPPMIFVAKQGSTANPFALFLVYDPDAGTCVGTSYIIKLSFDPDPLGTILIPATNVYQAGAGASSGFAIAGEKVVVSRSYVGENGRAYLQEVPNLRIPQGSGSGTVSWWLERQ